jgi:cation diffusion facilitator CzcD-associated flavoprotein CzcO
MIDMEHFDVLVVGAGLSGIGAGYYLQKNCPEKTYAIFEGRDRMGGTWDLFRYPGIRSDSDMFTLGYSFRPWTGSKPIAGGQSILGYIKETAREYGIDRHIRFNHRVKRASWSSDKATWTIEVQQGDSGNVTQYTCHFLFICSGYYSYESGHTPEFAGQDLFQRPIVHPQQWPDDLAYEGKRIVVVGSGATAITLVPALAKRAGHVTMLQRSPTYTFSFPDKDVISDVLKKFLPAKWAYGLTRWKNVFLYILIYQLSRRRPEWVKKQLREQVRKQLGDDFDIDTHFKPPYNPWDQRLCLVPNGDLFQAIRQGKASVVTDHIDTLTEKGVRLKSGKELEADILVTATGLNLLALGGVTFEVDGREMEIPKTVGYKGMMLSDIPNLVMALGYTNNSWTLKCDLTCEYVCRLLKYMDRHGYRQCMPHSQDPSLGEEALLDLTSGYVLRSMDKFPKQGTKAPWRVYQNYLLDIMSLRFRSVKNKDMLFTGVPETPRSDATEYRALT